MTDRPTSHTPATSPCLEIAVYTVHAAEADAFPRVQAAMHDTLRALPGFIGSERLRGVNTPTLFADYIHWASRAAAEAASAQMPSHPGADRFLAAIETMRTFAHLPITPAPDA